MVLGFFSEEKKTRGATCQNTWRHLSIVFFPFLYVASPTTTTLIINNKS